MEEEKREPFYLDYFALVPKKKLVEERCQRISRVLPTEHGRLNVMIVGLDSLSRLNFQRQMPSSYKYLIEKMGAIEMFGYNKVADNTFPNLMAVLCGLSIVEMNNRCWNSSFEVFDNCPLVWNFFEYNGYRSIPLFCSIYISVQYIIQESTLQNWHPRPRVSCYSTENKLIPRIERGKFYFAW